MEKWIFAAGTATAYAWHVLVLQADARNGPAEVYGFAAFYTAGFAVAWLIVKIHAVRWAEVEPHGRLRRLVEHALGPAAALMVSTRGACVLPALASPWAVSMFVLTLAAFADAGGTARRRIAAHFPRRASDDALYLAVPPRRARDLLPMHLLVVLLFALLGMRLFKYC